jgi:hypothetical protein
MSFVARSLGDVLTVLFVVGMAGCVLVIPITAKRLFSVLFEKDVPGEK